MSNQAEKRRKTTSERAGDVGFALMSFLQPHGASSGMLVRMLRDGCADALRRHCGGPRDPRIDPQRVGSEGDGIAVAAGPQALRYSWTNSSMRRMASMRAGVNFAAIRGLGL